MPILIVLIALFVPRLVVAALWFFSNWFAGVFDSLAWPIVGFLFAPLTLLWYSVVINVWDHWGVLQIAVLILTLLIDLSPAKRRKK